MSDRKHPGDFGGHDYSYDHDYDNPEPHRGVPPGKAPVTARLAARPQTNIVFRMADAATASAFAGAFGTRDENHVAEAAPDAVSRASASAGQPLPDDVRERFEGSLGADLGNVRIHTGSESANASKALGARAYTTGTDIHFNEGEYNPVDPFGLHLLAHEVAHTVQQSGSRSAYQTKLEVSTPGDSLEHEADRAADAMLRGDQYRVESLALPTVHRSLDEEMKEQGKNYGEQRSSGKRVQIIGSHSVVSDASEAESIVAKINAQEENIGKAAGEWFNGGVFDSCQKDNAQTKFLLEDYAASLKQSGGALDGFKPAYETVRADYGRLVGMAAAFTGNVGETNITETQAIETTTEKLKVETKGMSKKVQALQDTSSKFKGHVDALKAARDELETARDGIQKQNIKVKSAGNAMKAAVARVQADAAAAKADEKEAELATLRAKIGDVSGAIGTAFELSGKLAGAVQNQAGTVQTNRFVDEFVQVHNRMVAMQSQEHSVEMPPDQMARLKAVGQDLASGKVEAAVEFILTSVLSGKISELSGAISAAKEEETLNKAVAAQADLETAKADYDLALKAMQTLLISFEKLKKRVDSQIEQCASFATKVGNPKMAAAFRFLGASEAFLAQADVAIEMGNNQQEAGRDALNKRDNINKEGKTYEGRRHWWEVVESEEFSWRSVVEGERNLKEYSAIKHSVELKSAGKEGLLDGGGNSGTQFDVAGALSELRNQQQTIRGLQQAAQAATGVGDAIVDLSGGAANG